MALWPACVWRGCLQSGGSYSWGVRLRFLCFLCAAAHALPTVLPCCLTPSVWALVRRGCLAFLQALSPGGVALLSG